MKSRSENMKDMLLDEFQYVVLDLLIRDKSVLDQMSKYQDSVSRLLRSIVKAATQCGCISITASKQEYPLDADYSELKDIMKTHVEGHLCEACKEQVENDIGRNLFYLTSLCNTLDLNLYDILLKEMEKSKTLGKYCLR